VFRKYCAADYCNDWLKLEEAASAAQIGLAVLANTIVTSSPKNREGYLNQPEI